MKRNAVLSVLSLAGGVAAQSSSQVTVTVLPVASSTTTIIPSSFVPIGSIGTTSSPASTSTFDGTVTVTTTRTFTDYCGCGISGVSTINGGTLASTSSSSTTSTTSTSITSTMSTTSTTSISGLSISTSVSTGQTLLPPPTVTTSISTTSNTNDGVLTGTSSTATTTSALTSTSTTSTSSLSPSASTSASTSISTSTSTITPSGVTTTTTAPISSTTTSSATTTTSSAGAVVTDEAYIDTVLRHHNVHRANHTVSALVWSPALAETARKIASSCVYAHNTSVDGGGYGQNIGAGYPSTNMGAFITLGLYNGEVNSYTYYGGEPNTATVGQWGHFSQIVWKSTTAVGCYTYDCSANPGGLQNTGAGVPPFFSVCNYSPAGNVVGSFGANVLRPVGNPSVFADYECPTPANCVGPTT